MNLKDIKLVLEHCKTNEIDPMLVMTQLTLEGLELFTDNKLNVKFDYKSMAIAYPILNVTESITVGYNNQNLYEYCKNLLGGKTYDFVKIIFPLKTYHEYLGFSNSEELYGFLSESFERFIQVYFRLIIDENILLHYQVVNYQEISKYFEEDNQYAIDLEIRYGMIKTSSENN